MGGSYQPKIEIACHATSSPEANKDETAAQEPPSTPVAPPRHPKTDTEGLQLRFILCSTDMDSIEQPVDSSERLEVQMPPCSIVIDDAIADAETMDDNTLQLNESFDQDTSLDTLAFELDSFFCSTPLDSHQLEITFEWIDAPLMHTTIVWQPSKPDVTNDSMSMQSVYDVASEQGQLKDQCLDSLEDGKEPCHVVSSEAAAIVVQPRPPPVHIPLQSIIQCHTLHCLIPSPSLSQMLLSFSLITKFLPEYYWHRSVSR